MKNLSNTEAELKKKRCLLKKACKFIGKNKRKEDPGSNEQI